MVSDDLKYELIVAHDDNRAIGYKMKLPWSIPSEFQYFVRMSSTPNNPSRKCVAVMGSQSWLALPESSRPFPKCINIILSTKMEQPEGMDDVYVCRSWQDMEELLRSKDVADRRDRIWIHGGNTVYLKSLESPHFHRLYRTHVRGTYDADAFFPDIPIKLKKVNDPDVPQGVIQDSGYTYEVEVFEKAD